MLTAVRDVPPCLLRNVNHRDLVALLWNDSWLIEHRFKSLLRHTCSMNLAPVLGIPDSFRSA